MELDDQEEALLRSVTLQNARAVLLARERAERDLLEAKQSLERKNRELAEQREWFRVTLASIGDAVITTDTEGKVTFLNRLAEAMTGWRLKEAFGKPLENVFDIINEESRKPAPNLMAKALRDGNVVGLANHTALVSRDGREIAIEDSAAPIRDATGKVIGAVMVFHDVTERRRAEEEIAKTAERLRLALEAGELGDWSWNAATDLVTFGPRVADVFGVSADRPMTWADLRQKLHEEDRERARLAVEQALANRKDYRIEYRVQRSPGEWLWVAARGRGVYGAKGEVIGMIGVVLDVTARKRTQEAQSTLAAVVESSDDAILSTTLDGVITTWNEGAERMYGFAASEAIGQPVTIVIPPGRHDEEPAIVERLKRGERVDHYETVRSRKDGTLVNVSLTVSPIRDESGNVVGASKIARDITQSRRAQEVRSTLAAVVESSDDAIVSTTLDGVITTWNEGAARMYGFSAAEAIGQPVTIVLPPDRRDEEPAILERLRRGERVDHYETVRSRKDGTLVNVSLTVSPIRDASGNVVGASKIARDITQSKRAQEELSRHAETLEKQVAQRTAHLRESVESLEAVCYTIAHDLRAPLRAVQGFTKILVDDYAPAFDAHGRQMAGRIVTGAARMDALIRDLLQYARLSHIDLPCKNIELRPMVEKLRDELAPELTAKGGEIDLAPLPAVWANATIVEQVFANLIGNSLKFVREIVPPKVKIWAQPIEGRVRIFVEDNGIGIEPRYHHRLFGMFQRLHGDEKKYPGTGVGLAIVKKGMERMGGRAGVETREPPGARFYLDFKAAEPS